jgi:MFS family permease
VLPDKEFSAGVPTRPLSYRDVLRLPNIRPLLLATCCARLAGRMFMLAIVLYALERFGSPVLAGWVAFLTFAPGMAISPLAGALLDRVGAARAIIVDMAAGTLLVSALALSGVAGTLHPPLLLALTAIYSLTGPLGAAGIRTLIPFLVPTDALDRANALDNGSFALIDMSGPALAGGLFALIGGEATMAAIAAQYGVAGLSLLRLRHAGPSRADRKRSLLREAADGVVYVIRHRALRGLAAGYALGQASWGIMLVVVPVFVARVFGAGGQADTFTGLVWTADGIAACAGSLIAGHLRSAGRERHFIGIGVLLVALAIWPVAASLGLAGVFAGMALAGFFGGFVDVGTLTLRQRVTDPAWFGRTLAVSMSLNMCGLPIGSAVGGALAAWSLDAAFAVAAAVAVLAAVVTYALIPEG